MSAYPYNMLVGEQDTITIAGIAAAMGPVVGGHTWMGADASVKLDDSGIVYQGRRMHNDSCPTAWRNALTTQGINPSDVVNYNPVLDPNIFWSGMNAWVVVVVDANNTCTNAFTKIFDYQIYYKSKATGLWVRVNSSSNGLPKFALDWYLLANFSALKTGVTYYAQDGRPCFSNVPAGAGDGTIGVSTDRDVASAATAKYRMLHNSLMSSAYVDGADVDGVFATCKAQLCTLDGAAFNATPNLLLSLGIDFKYKIGSVLNTDKRATGDGDLRGVGYHQACGGSVGVPIPSDGSVARFVFSTSRHTGTSISAVDTSPYVVANGHNALSYSETAMSLIIPTLTLPTAS